MAETPKVLSALLAQLPDNTTGLISPEDIRDVVVSLFPSRGQLDLTATAATTFALTDTWYKLAGTTALDATLGQDGFSQAANNELRATKAVNQVLLVTANVELLCASNNKTFGLTFAKNGTAITGIHVSALLANSNKGYGFSITALLPTAANDTISVYVRNETDTTSVTATSLTLSAVGFIR
jgi:hypothetical protein